LQELNPFLPTHLIIHLVEKLDLCGPVHTMDVPDRKVHESFKRLWLEYAIAKKDHGN
jgi:hypothetical protein